jgi:hypothetical protein
MTTMNVQKSPFVIPMNRAAMGIDQIGNVVRGIINWAGGKLGTIRLMPKKSTNVVANILLANDIFSPASAFCSSAPRNVSGVLGFFASMIRH